MIFYVNKLYIDLMQNCSNTGYCLRTWTYGHNGNDYRVSTLSKSYWTVTGIIMQSLVSIGQFKHAWIKDKSYPYKRTYGPNLIIEKLRYQK